MKKVKQVIVIRKDLNMRAGKMVSQGAHASLAVTLDNLHDARVRTWLDDKFTKTAIAIIDYEENFIGITDHLKLL